MEIQDEKFRLAYSGQTFNFDIRRFNFIESLGSRSLRVRNLRNRDLTPIPERAKESLDREKARQLAEEYQGAAAGIRGIGRELDGVSIEILPREAG